MQDIVCVSHLRWDFVWQRPQQLLSRLAQYYRVFFIEEPTGQPDLQQPTLKPTTWHGDANQSVTVIQLQLPMQEPRWISHGDSFISDIYNSLLMRYLEKQGVNEPLLWLYTPMGFPFIEAIQPQVLVYDVMDQLSAFKGAPADLRIRDGAVLKQADVVFTGGISLYRDKARFNPNTYVFPSGVDEAHFASGNNTNIPPELAALNGPILGYFGVIDERMDLELLCHIAEQHPEWQIVMIGPVVKISEDELPHKPNIHYLGMKPYAELPHYLANFDVALVPFALNEATRFVSPTKVLEYMAAHKPIVSTPIHDVIELYGSVVYIGHTHAEFVKQVEQVLNQTTSDARIANEKQLLARNAWNAIADEMAEIMEQTLQQNRQPIQPISISSITEPRNQ